MDLIDDDVVVFDSISHWLYTGTTIKNGVDRHSQANVLRIYPTAEKYCMVNLKNYLVTIFFEIATVRHRGIPSISLVESVYSTTSQNSGFRKLLVALYTWRMNKETWLSMISLTSLRLVPDFATDLAFALGNRQFVDSTGDPFQGKAEDFYE